MGLLNKSYMAPDRGGRARCGVQQAGLGQRSHKHDPLYRIRRTLLTAIEKLNDAARERA